MTNLPLIPAAIHDIYGVNTAASEGTQLSLNSYVTIATSTTRAYDAIFVQANVNNSAGNNDNMINVAIGPSGSEQVVAQLKTSTQIAGFTDNYQYYLPISIPQGTRLSALYNSNTGSNVVITIAGKSGALLADHGCAYSEVIGIAQPDASPSGTVIDPGATANTLGAWTELVASSAHNYSYLSFIAGGNNGNAALSEVLWLFDIGVGASGSEIVVIPQICLVSTDNATPSPLVSGPYPVAIPAGTRIAARAQCNNIDVTATSRKLDVGLIGFVR
jgi:hypothetical protein